MQDGVVQGKVQISTHEATYYFVVGTLVNVKCYTNSKCAGSYTPKSRSQCCSVAGSSYQNTGSKTCYTW